MQAVNLLLLSYSSFGGARTRLIRTKKGPEVASCDSWSLDLVRIVSGAWQGKERTLWHVEGDGRSRWVAGYAPSSDPRIEAYGMPLLS